MTALPAATRLFRMTAIAAVIGTAGCAQVAMPDYPATWAALERDAPDCTRLAGSYEDFGVAAAPSTRYGRLWWMLFGSQPGSIDRVVIAPGAGGELWVTAWNGSTRVDARPLRTARSFAPDPPQMHCRDGRIVMSSRSSMAGAGAAGRGVAGLELAKAADGSLVIRRFDGYVAAHPVPPLPWVVRSQEWYRFDPAKDGAHLPVPGIR